jgi:hypothetical protein
MIDSLSNCRNMSYECFELFSSVKLTLTLTFTLVLLNITISRTYIRVDQESFTIKDMKLDSTDDEIINCITNREETDK